MTVSENKRAQYCFPLPKSIAGKDAIEWTFAYHWRGYVLFYFSLFF
jgi:hypothetical protein